MKFKLQTLCFNICYWKSLIYEQSMVNIYDENHQRKHLVLITNVDWLTDCTSLKLLIAFP